jgi:hypothetical protein
MKIDDPLNYLLLMAMNSKKFTVITIRQKCLRCGKIVAITVKSASALRRGLTRPASEGDQSDQSMEPSREKEV